MEPISTYHLVEGSAAVYIESPVLKIPGVVHGFATRQGGISQGPFASLNFGLKAGDDPRNVRANTERLAEAVGFDAKRLFRLCQVHGNRARVIGAKDAPSDCLFTEADALATDVPGVTLGVLTADCVPVCFADAQGRRVGVAHAGWRGLVAGVLEGMIEVFEKRWRVAPPDIRVAVGPCIGVCCYEVGEEVAEQFAEIPGSITRKPAGRPLLDLQTSALFKLRALGIPDTAICVTNLCTRCHPELFFSYRRDGQTCGHHISVIGRGFLDAQPFPSGT